MAEIEGSCNEVQPVAKTIILYAFQRIKSSDWLDPIFQVINKLYKYTSFMAFDR